MEAQKWCHKILQLLGQPIPIIVVSWGPQPEPGAPSSVIHLI